MHKIGDKVDSKFRFVLLAAERAEQIIRGAKPRLEASPKIARTAMKEIRQGLIEWDYGPRPEPEIEVAAAAGKKDEGEAASESDVH